MRAVAGGPVLCVARPQNRNESHASDDGTCLIVNEAAWWAHALSEGRPDALFNIRELFANLGAYPTRGLS